MYAYATQKKNVGNKTVLGPFDFYCVLFLFLSVWKSIWWPEIFKILKKKSYKFGTTWGEVNDDRIFILGWTIHLMQMAD